MRINFKLPVKNLRGKAFQEDIVDDSGTKTGSKDLVLGTLAVNSLLDTNKLGDDGRPVQERLTGQEKVQRAKLAHKIYDAVEDGDGIVALKSEELTLIKNRIGEFYPPLFVNAAFDLLEGEAQVPDAPKLVAEKESKLDG